MVDFALLRDCWGHICTYSRAVAFLCQQRIIENCELAFSITGKLVGKLSTSPVFIPLNASYSKTFLLGYVTLQQLCWESQPHPYIDWRVCSCCISLLLQNTWQDVTDIAEQETSRIELHDVWTTGTPLILLLVVDGAVSHAFAECCVALRLLYFPSSSCANSQTFL